jgi:hypothetical protein
VTVVVLWSLALLRKLKTELAVARGVAAGAAADAAVERADAGNLGSAAAPLWRHHTIGAGTLRRAGLGEQASDLIVMRRTAFGRVEMESAATATAAAAAASGVATVATGRYCGGDLKRGAKVTLSSIYNGKL